MPRPELPYHVITELPPDADFAPLAVKEFLSTEPPIHDLAMLDSEVVYEVCDLDEVLFVLGVKKTSVLAERHELWFLMCTPFLRNIVGYLRATRELLRQLREIFPKLHVQVAKGEARAERFARFFGFQYHHEAKIAGETFRVFTLWP